MNREEFTEQVKRLKDTWPTSFPDEKVKVIWAAVNQHEKKWFSKTVTDMIANNRQAPLPTEFMHAANLHERYELFRFPTKDEIKPNEGSIFSKDDVAEIFSMIRKRLDKKISYKDFQEYEKIIKNAVDEKPRCKLCDDGVVFETKDKLSSPSVFKCNCMLGRRCLENWPQYQGAVIPLKPTTQNDFDDNNPIGAA